MSYFVTGWQGIGRIRWLEAECQLLSAPLGCWAGSARLIQADPYRIHIDGDALLLIRDTILGEKR